jgi:hypothetical protein
MSFLKGILFCLLVGLTACQHAEIKSVKNGGDVLSSTEPQNFKFESRSPAAITPIENANRVCEKIASWYNSPTTANECMGIVKDGTFDKLGLAVCDRLASWYNSPTASIECLHIIKNKSYDSNSIETCYKLGAWYNSPSSSLVCLKNSGK